MNSVFYGNEIKGKTHPILTILQKQLKDTMKNKAVLLQFLMFPILGLIMTKSVKMEDMPPNFFVYLFAVMYVGMAPLVSVSAIISEEKEKNTLRVLLMAGVKPRQYLLGIGCYVFSACMLGSAVFGCLLEGGTFQERMQFLLILAIGIVASILLGAAIGVGSRNQMAATSLTVPVMLVFAFLPMLSMFNEVMAKVAKFTYTEQIRLLISSLNGGSNMEGILADGIEHMFTIGVNVLVFGGVFYVCFKRNFAKYL